MIQTEEQVMEKLKIKHWVALTWDNFMEYLQLVPDIPDDLNTRIIQKVPDFALVLNQSAAMLHINMGAKMRVLLDRQDALDDCMRELKAFVKERNVPEEGLEKVLLISRKVAGVYKECQGSNRSINLLAKYAILLLVFIYRLSDRWSE